MVYIHSIATAVPERKVNQKDVREFAGELFKNSGLDIERLLPVFTSTEIKQRAILKDIPWYSKTRTFKEKNEAFLEDSLELSRQAALKLFESAKVHPEEIDALIVVSSSGFVVPTLDARLIDILGIPTDAIRLPIVGLGCAGGAFSLARAREISAIYPEKNILVIAVESCTLTFRPADKRKANLIALSLFSDGAAAILISGKPKEKSIMLKSSKSRKWRESLDVMGWDIEEDGLQVVFDKSIPWLIKENFLNFYEKFLLEIGINKDSIKHYLMHPGGKKVLQAFGEALNLPESSFSYSKNVLENYGNMSSPTVFFVIGDFIKSQNFKAKESGIISAMGPGFTCDLLHFETT